VLMNDNRGARVATLSATLGALFFTLAIGATCATLVRHSNLAYLDGTLLALSSALFCIAAGYLSAVIAVKGKPKQRARHLESSVALRGPRIFVAFIGKLHTWLYAIQDIHWRERWIPILATLVLSALSLAAAWKSWTFHAVTPPGAYSWIIGALLASSFPVLVLERQLSAMPAHRLIDPQDMQYFLRLLLVVLIGIAFSYVVQWLDFSFWNLIFSFVLLLTSVVAIELLFRAARFFFLPFPPHGASLGIGRSSLTHLLRLQRPSLAAMRASIRAQLGIDLGRSWALAFIGDSIQPIVWGMVAVGWLMTGVSSLDLSQRAVYEVFGTPQTVFHSGLHVYLPWPFGRLRPVELGTVHEIPIAFPDLAQYPGTIEQKRTETSSVEGNPPSSADRLWEASRPTEESYLVASNQNGNQNFEVVNIDLRVIYRVGLSDEAAYSTVYSLASSDDLIRDAAGRMLARYFAKSSIDGILGENRDIFIRSFQRELQQRLNSLSKSIEILGVVIETIHPPAGAAQAYQDVQASSINAATKIADAKGDAVRDLEQAKSDATDAKNTATAEAAETLAQAKLDTALFAGDVLAYHKGGPAFLLERRLSVLQSAITPDTHLTIVDHRIPASQVQLMELRLPSPSSITNP
jgi:regulator of protease activity HflC (stomatin/prohibitin superfamily)